MIEIKLQKIIAKPSQLDYSIRNALVSKYLGLSYDGLNDLVIRFSNDSTQQERDTAVGLTDTYDQNVVIIDPFQSDYDLAKQQAGNNPLDNITINQAMNWIDNNVISLATIIVALKWIVKFLFVLDRRLKAKGL